MKRLLFLSAILATPLAAQQQAPTAAVQPVGDTSLFAPIQWPTANEYRTGSGAPGAHYWQNRADYDINASLDTATKTLHGQLTMRYTNNSPDTLRYIWIQTEQNAFKANSLNSFIFPADSRFGAQNFAGGDVIERYEEVFPATTKGAARHVKVVLHDNETVTRVDLAEPLVPGHTATFDVAWHFLIPEHGADRMGRDGALFELAQWYPRMCVYDDIRGWNTDPYLGQGEFYLDYGDYNLALTVPAGYIVAATGTLANPTEVLTAPEIGRLARAAKSDTTIPIITAAELKNGTARPRSTGTMVWHFASRNVRDAVWAASPDYQWDASSYKGAMAFAYYRPSATLTWIDAADQARMSIMEYSERWYPYPWPQISAVEGPISGMEYPMLAMETKSRDKFDLYNVVTHEIGHMWFPMLVGSNERMYMWQDEGFNTFINYFSEARRYPQNGDVPTRVARDRDELSEVMRRGYDKPVMINPDRINPELLGISAYNKPAIGLALLRDEILGPEMFDASFREYIRRWAYKHPSPADFFRTVEDVSGRRLDWFWREWFLENERFDQAIDTVATGQSGDTMRVAVLYGNRERGVLPIRARFTFTDGTTQDFNYPAEVWSTNTEEYEREYTFPGKKLAKIELDPDHHLIDINRANNTWPKTP
ncbi:MAG TPA: M1 family metallopeptidase [Gemmatimonadales bacterium]|jgi:opacity protein-like surface antigen|nr:M1 family metallopeptidase [Gemmatimonadales bacterium]